MANKAASKKPGAVKAPKPAPKAGSAGKSKSKSKKATAGKAAPVEAAGKTVPSRPLEVRSLEARVTELSDRSEMLAARVSALELALRKVLEHWPQGRGKLRKALHTRSKRVGRSVDKSVPAIDRPSWQKAIDELIASID